MKRTILTFVLAVVTMMAMGQKSVVWENPSAFMGRSNAEFEITKVEMKQTETVLHVDVNYNPGYWIRFAKESFLQTPDGKTYVITGGEATTEKEFDLVPDSLFWMPQSGQASLALHFQPVPLDTEEMDFSEGDSEGAFHFWNICNSKAKKKLELPADWQNVTYAKDETLPVAKINKGVATIKVKMLGYKPGMKLEFYVGGFTPLGSRERVDKFFPFADDGTVKIEMPLWLAREVSVGVQGLAFSNIVIAPGQETSILMKVTTDNRPFIAFKGYLAKTNMDLVDADNTFEPYCMDEENFLKVRKCKTKEERLQCLTDLFNQRVAAFKKAKYTTAAKDLLCMAAEENYIKWSRQFATNYSQFRLDEDGTVYETSDGFEENYQKNKELLSLSEEESAYTWKYLNEPGSPCSIAFWDTALVAYEEQLVERPNYNRDLQLVPMLLKKEDEQFVNRVLQTMKHEDCKAVVHEYQAEQQRIAQQLTSQESVFFQKYDDVAPENILQTILDKYKGKTVVIDIWATWCGPCRAGHQAMKPMKEDMKGKNIQFVYITSSTSPLSTWQEMIKEIDGDHYYLTKEQYSYILNKYESEGIPTYAIYDRNGNQTFKTIGFPGVETIREELEKAIGK
ncbi:MAG: redoxin family protein [Bacteroidaceae bacterium]|nr:redoxin family protein [Bacteroidaceae bacterium]